MIMNSPGDTSLHSSPRSARNAHTLRSERGARLRFYILLFPVFVKILCLHFVCPQEKQFGRLGRCRARRSPPLPDAWARWAANKITRLVHRIPGIRQRPCYWRCQLMYDLLPRFGFPLELHLGAQPEADRIITHLWVTLAGVVLADDPGCNLKYIELAVYSTEAAYD
jgi:hypothetical protein